VAELADLLDLAGLLRVLEVTATGVELHHLHERGGAAVVEVRTGQLDVAERRRLDRAIHDRVHGARTASRRQGVAERIAAAHTDVARGRTHADVVEAGVDRRGGTTAQLRGLRQAGRTTAAEDRAERGIRELSARVAAGALVLERAHAGHLAGG